MKALSIRQPWAWAILHAGKDIENRDWPTSFRGPVLIHAGQKADCEVNELTPLLQATNFQDWSKVPLAVADLPRGGIVGRAEIVDCVFASDSKWFFGDYGFVIRNAEPLPFTPLKGRLGFFDVPGWTWPLVEGWPKAAA